MSCNGPVRNGASDGTRMQSTHEPASGLGERATKKDCRARVDGL